jgi:SOS-response transcriptional repressor LexA
MDNEWIIKGLEKPGKTKQGLAKTLGRHPAVVTNILTGKREIKAREIELISKYLEVDAPDQPAFVPNPHIVTAYVVGDVAGGVWAEPGVHFEPFPSTVVVDGRWPPKSVYLLRVRGSSINRQAKDGDFVLCLDVFAAPRDFQPGDWVVVERTDDGGRCETTVKQVRGNRQTGFALYPDSDDPTFQSPITIGAQDGVTVKVKAFVLEFIRHGTSF